MMKKIPFIIVLGIILFSLVVPVITFAASGSQPSGHRMVAVVTLEESLKPQYASDIKLDPNTISGRAAVGNIALQLIAGSLIYVAGPVAILMIAVGGFRYVISHGEQTQMDGAKKTITWAIIGLIVIIISYAIVTNVIKIISATGQGSSQSGSTPPAGKTPPPGPASKDSSAKSGGAQQ